MTVTGSGTTGGGSSDADYPAPFRGQYVARSDSTKEVLEGFNPHVAGKVVIHDGSRSYVQNPVVATPPTGTGFTTGNDLTGGQGSLVQGEQDDNVDPDYLERMEWRRRRRESNPSPSPQPVPLYVSQPQPLNYGPSQLEVGQPPSPYQSVQQSLPVDMSDAGLGFIGLHQPIKPTKQVIFTLPGLGDWTVRFHEVVLTHNAVVLLYDNRYTEGMQFVPASGNATITVRIPSEKAVVHCVSLGLSWSVGCMDCVVLVRKDDGDGEER